MGRATLLDIEKIKAIHNKTKARNTGNAIPLSMVYKAETNSTPLKILNRIGAALQNLIPLTSL
ncbi:hypothetical protein KUL42_15750 [Alteromonas sp. KUL42]|nr:hypothetical protein KUL42_15750 [Alteromonas sp. KUL42]